jgi:hypothetical protein
VNQDILLEDRSSPAKVEPFWLARQTIRQPDSIQPRLLDDLSKTWRDKGRQTIEWTADNQPETFFAVFAS